MQSLGKRPCDSSVFQLILYALVNVLFPAGVIGLKDLTFLPNIRPSLPDIVSKLNKSNRKIKLAFVRQYFGESVVRISHRFTMSLSTKLYTWK